MAIPFFTSHWARLARANKHDGPGDEPGGDADQASSEHDAAPDAEEPENVDAAEEPGLPEGPPESRVQKATGMLKGIVDKAASPIEERAFAPTEEKGAPKPGPFGRFVLSLERLVLSPLYESEDSIGVNQMARLIVVWLLIIGAPLLILGLSLVREFSTGEPWRLKDRDVMCIAQTARNVAEGKGFVTNVVDPLVLQRTQKLPDTPELRNRPAYVLLLAALFKIAPAKDVTVIAVACVMWLMTVWLSYAVAMRWGDRRVGMLTLAFVSVNFIFVTTAADGIELCFKALLLVLFLWFLTDIARSLPEQEAEDRELSFPKLSLKMLFAFGLLCGVMTVTAYGYLVLILPVAVMLLFVQRRATWAGRFLFLAGLLLPVIPWLVHVAAATGGNPLFDPASFSLLSDVRWHRTNYLRETQMAEGGEHSLWRMAMLSLSGVSRKLRKNADDVMVAFVNCVGLVACVLFVAHALGNALTDRRRRSFFLPMYVGILLYGFLAALTVGSTSDLALFAPVIALGAAQLVCDVIDKPKEHPLWFGEWSGPALRWSICILLVFASALPLLGGHPYMAQPRFRAPELTYLERQLAKREVDSEIILTDEPEMTAWYLKQPSIRLPLRNSDLDSILDIARINQQDIAGFFLLRSKDPLTEQELSCRWMRYVYTPAGVYRNTKAVRGSRQSMVYRLALGRLPESEKQEDRAESTITAFFDEDIRKAVRAKDRVAAYKIALECLEKEEYARAAQAAFFAANDREFLDAQRRYIQIMQLFDNLDAYREALPRAEWVVSKLAPDYADAHAQLAAIYARLGRYKDASLEFRRMVALGGTRLDLFTAAQTSAHLNDRRRAMQFCKALIERRKDKEDPYPKPMIELTDLCFSVGLYDDAIDLSKKLIKQFPDDAWLQQRMCRILVSSCLVTERASEAVPVADEVAAAWPSWRYGKRLQGEAYAGVGRYDEAMLKYREWAQTREEKTELYALLASIYEKNKNYQALERVCRDGLDRSPFDIGLLLPLARYYAHKGINLEEAEELARAALRLLPGSMDCADALAWVLYKRKNFAEAEESLKPHETSLWRKPEMAYHYAAIQHELGDGDKARRFVSMALEKAEKDEDWKEDARRLSAELGGTEESNAQSAGSDASGEEDAD